MANKKEFKGMLAEVIRSLIEAPIPDRRQGARQVPTKPTGQVPTKPGAAPERRMDPKTRSAVAKLKTSTKQKPLRLVGPTSNYQIYADGVGKDGQPQFSMKMGQIKWSPTPDLSWNEEGAIAWLSSAATQGIASISEEMSLEQVYSEVPDGD